MLRTKPSLFVRSARRSAVRVLLVVGASLPLCAQAKPPGLVIKGQEIVYSASDGGSQMRLATPRLIRPRKQLYRGAVGVAALPSRGPRSYGARIEAERAAISRHCGRIRKMNPTVEISCEANSLVQLDRTPNDTDFVALWGLGVIGAPAAWEISTGSRSVLVAIVDTGVDYRHPDLSANIQVNAQEIPDNSIDDDRNGYVDDYYGYDFANGDGDPVDDHFHGTHCAGTIGAQGNNNRGVVGVAWTTSILPVKVIYGEGWGTLAAVASGIRYAVRRGAKVINLSLGHGQSDVVEAAIQDALQADVVLVAAAGNNGIDNDQQPTYPSSSPSENVIAVAATDPSDTLTSWSNFGAQGVDVAAPGLSILSTGLNGDYQWASGTSMATPHVAGVVAVLRAVNPSLTFDQIKELLRATAVRNSSLNGRVASGRVDLNAALLAAGGVPQATATSTSTPTATPTVTRTSTHTPTPTATPTVTPSPTLTPNLTPRPLETPASTRTPRPTPTFPASYYRGISVVRHRRSGGTRITGDITNTNNNPVMYAGATLVCEGLKRRSTRTGGDGSYMFFVRTSNTRIRCFIVDDRGSRSALFTVR